MTKVLLDFYFSTDLLLDARLDDFGFVQALEREDVVRFNFGADHVYATEFALSKRAADVERVQVPFAGRLCSAGMSRSRTAVHQRDTPRDARIKCQVFSGFPVHLLASFLIVYLEPTVVLSNVNGGRFGDGLSRARWRGSSVLCVRLISESGWLDRFWYGVGCSIFGEEFCNARLTRLPRVR